MVLTTFAWWYQVLFGALIYYAESGSVCVEVSCHMPLRKYDGISSLYVPMPMPLIEIHGTSCYASAPLFLRKCYEVRY